jgi:hypothetical protein
MADLTMADVRAKFPQYSNMSDDDLAAALHSKFYPDMKAEDFASKIGYTMPTKPTIQPNTGLAGPLGDVADAAAKIGGAPADILTSALSHVASGAFDPMVGLGARIHAVLTGHDPEAAAQAAHKWMADKATFHAVTPAGQTVEDAARQTMSGIAAPFNAAGNAIANTIPASARPTADKIAGWGNDIAGTAASLFPAAQELRETLGAGNLANPANVAKTGSEIGDAAGYQGVHSQQDLKMPGPQGVTDKLIADDAGVPNGQALNVKAVQNARKIGPGKVYDAAQAALPESLSMDEGLTGDLGKIGDTVSQLPKSPDVEALKTHMLGQPNMSRDELFANIQQARQQGSANLASDIPDKNALGAAQLKLAQAYEDFAGRRLADNPQAGVTQEDFINARTQFAKNYMAEAALKGGEHIDPMAYARAHAADPDMLTGNSAVVGQHAAALPAQAPFGAQRGMLHALGAGTGALAGHLLGGGAGSEVAGAMIGTGAAPYINRAIHNIFQRGDMGAAASTADNPALSYLFGEDHQFPPSESSGYFQEPPKLLTHQPAEPTVNAGGGAATDSLLNELGLTGDVQRAGPAHPGTAREGVLPPEPQSMPAVTIPTPHPQNWVGPGGSNFSLAPDFRGTPMEDVSDNPDVLSGHPTPTTGTGGPEGTIDDIIQSALFKKNSQPANARAKARASTLKANPPGPAWPDRLGDDLTE